MKTNLLTLITTITALALILISCSERDNPVIQDTVQTPVDNLSSRQELISVVDNLMCIADYVFHTKKVLLSPTVTQETVYIQGRADGSIETQRHTTVKGAPLISVRLTRGLSDLSTSTITRTYDSEEDFSNDVISSEKISTVKGLASGQIQTTLTRNSTAVCNTFKTPVITVKKDITTKRQGLADGSVEVVRFRTDNGNLISRTLIYGRADGAILTKRIYADASWQIVAVKGKADGTIEKTVTTSEPTSVVLEEPVDITDDSLTLSWSQNTDQNFAQYEVYQSQISYVTLSDTLVATLENPAKTTISLDDLSAQTTYYFRVFVINDVGQAVGSNEVRATTK